MIFRHDVQWDSTVFNVPASSTISVGLFAFHTISGGFSTFASNRMMSFVLADWAGKKVGWESTACSGPRCFISSLDSRPRANTGGGTWIREVLGASFLWFLFPWWLFLFLFFVFFLLLSFLLLWWWWWWWWSSSSSSFSSPLRGEFLDEFSFDKFARRCCCLSYICRSSHVHLTGCCGYLKDILKELNHCNIVKCISTPRTLAGGLCLIAWAFCLLRFLWLGMLGTTSSWGFCLADRSRRFALAGILYTKGSFELKTKVTDSIINILHTATLHFF